MSESVMDPPLPCQLGEANRVGAAAAMLSRETSTPSSTQATVSTITTAPSDEGVVDFYGGGGGAVEESRGEEGGEEGECLTVLTLI